MDGLIFYIVIIVIGIVLSLVKKAAEKLEQSNNPKTAPKTTHSRLIKCPACFFPNPADSSFCICCGQRLKQEKPAPPLPQKVQQAPKKGREPLKSRIKTAQPTEEELSSPILEESDRLITRHPLIDDSEELVKAIMLKEILDRPLALRQK